MREIFAQVAWVLKPRAKAAFVIGDATVDGKEFTTTREMAELAVDAGLVERVLLKTVVGLYNIMKGEKILIFRKD